MRIGIDTDGVLTDMSGYLLKIGKQYLRRDPVNPSAYHIEEMFDAGRFEKLFFGILLFLSYCKKCPPREGTQKVLTKLHDEGYALHEITARKFVAMKNPLGAYSKKLLLNWYKKHSLTFDGIIFCSEKNTGFEKTRACKVLGIKIMVEDRPEVAEFLVQNGITVLLFDAPYNQYLCGEHIIRCHNWNEVYENISTLKNQSE